jgi:hypothetical protein
MRDTPNAPKFDPSDQNDARFVAELTKDGVPNPDDLILAGYNACAMITRLRVRLTPAPGSWTLTISLVYQAVDVALAAMKVYCPTAEGRSEAMMLFLQMMVTNASAYWLMYIPVPIALVMWVRWHRRHKQ